MVNFFNPGANREFTGNRAQWNPARTNGNQFYGGPSQVPGHNYGGGMGMGGGMGGGGPSMTNWKPPGGYGGGMGGLDGGNPIPGVGNSGGVTSFAPNGPQTGGPLPPYAGGAERPGTYGRGGEFQPRPPTQYDIPGSGQGNGIPGMGAERPGVYGNPGPFNPMDPRQRGIPSGGRGNGAPGFLGDRTNWMPRNRGF